MYKPKAVRIKDDFYAVKETNWKPVNKKGEVLNKWGKPTKGFLGDYYRTNIDSNRIMSVNRVVALTFLPNDVDISSCDVNHIDGDKTNNNLSNLEWVTRSENVKHAVKNGLANVDRQIFVKDLYTGIIKRFNTVRAAARYIGCYQNSLHAYFHVRKEKLFRGKWSVKIGDEPWPVLDTANVTLFGMNVPNELVVVGLSTSGGINYLFHSVEALKLSIENFELEKEIDGYIYVMYNDIEHYVDDLNTLYNNLHIRFDLIDAVSGYDVKKPKKVQVISKSTGKSEVYNSLRSFSINYNKIPYNTLRSMIWRNKGDIGEYIINFVK